MSNSNPKLTALLNNKNELIFSVSGYAETRPIKGNNTDAERQENRRIDIRFSMSPPSDEDMSVVKFVKGRLNSNE